MTLSNMAIEAGGTRASACRRRDRGLLWPFIKDEFATIRQKRLPRTKSGGPIPTRSYEKTITIDASAIER